MWRKKELPHDAYPSPASGSFGTTGPGGPPDSLAKSSSTPAMIARRRGSRPSGVSARSMIR